MPQASKPFLWQKIPPLLISISPIISKIILDSSVVDTSNFEPVPFEKSEYILNVFWGKLPAFNLQFEFVSSYFSLVHINVPISMTFFNRGCFGKLSGWIQIPPLLFLGNDAFSALANFWRFSHWLISSTFILQIIEPLAKLRGVISRFPINKESVLSELFSPAEKKPNPDSVVSLFTCIFTLNLFEPEILLLFFGIDKPSIKIELIPESSVPTYFVEIILNAWSKSLSELLSVFPT